MTWEAENSEMSVFERMSHGRARRVKLLRLTSRCDCVLAAYPPFGDRGFSLTPAKESECPGPPVKR